MLILIGVSFFLAFRTDTGMVFNVEKVISFIGILSGLFGILSIFINFQVLTEVKNIEEQRLKTISKIKSEIFFRDDIVRAKEAIDKLLNKNTKQDFLQNDTLDMLNVVIKVCQNPLIIEKTNPTTEKNSILKIVKNMLNEIMRFKQSQKLSVQVNQQISSTLTTNFKVKLNDLKIILDEYVVTNLSDMIIED